LKNFNVSTKHFIARSRYRDGAGKKKEALINGCFDKLRHLRKNKLAFDKLRRRDKMKR
jgi:hypothetical protein